MNLEELRGWAPEIEDVAASVRDAAANHADSADFYRSLIAASTWEGGGADAASGAMAATAGDHDAVAEHLGAAATRIEGAAQEAATLAETIKGILDDAAAPPVLQVNETTNQVIAPDMSFMTEEYAAEVAAKVTDLRGRIAAALAYGARVDAELAGAITAAAGDGPVAAAASSLPELLVPGTRNRSTPQHGPPAAGPRSLDGALDQLTGASVPGAAGHPGATGAAAPIRWTRPKSSNSNQSRGR